MPRFPAEARVDLCWCYAKSPLGSVLTLLSFVNH
jgi:hypothetical protein